MKNWKAIVATGVVAVGMLGGCGTTSTTNSSSNASSSSSSASSSNSYTIGFAVSTTNNPFFVAMENGVKQEAAKLGVKVIVDDGNNDPSKQLNQVQDLIQQKVSAIILNPADSQALSSAVQAANSANIPVITLDRSVSSGKVACFIASDNVAAGKMAADELIKSLSGKGKVVELQGILGTSAERDREQGFDAEIASASGIQVVAKQTAKFDRSTALNVMQNIVQAHPDVSGVFAQNDEMALGAVKAISQAGKKNVAVVGIDGEQEAIQNVQDGSMFADIAQQPEKEGVLGVDYALKLVKHETVDSTVNSPLQLVEKGSSFKGF